MKKFIPLFLFIVVTIAIAGCDKYPGYCEDVVPSSPWSDLVWHPNGEILGFNGMPVKSGGRDISSCAGYDYYYYQDSIGFWLINKDGTDMRRATNFKLYYPTWSPDGKWLYFGKSGLHKMAFDGHDLDTAHILPAVIGGNLTWNPAGDTVYFSSQTFFTAGSYTTIYKTAATGGTPILIGNKGPDSGYYVSQPSYIFNNEILHIRDVNGFQQIFTMDTNGNNVNQVTYDTVAIDEAYNSYYKTVKQFPQAYTNRFFYQCNGIYAVNFDGTGRVKLSNYSTQNFSISKDGTIAFVLFNYGIIDDTYGVIWTMDHYGHNKKPLTVNHFKNN